MTWTTVIFGLGCVVLGMACVLLAFLAFKPIVMDFYATMAANAKREFQMAQSQRTIVTGTAAIEAAKTKSDKRGIFKPNRPKDEDVM